MHIRNSQMSESKLILKRIPKMTVGREYNTDNSNVSVTDHEDNNLEEVMLTYLINSKAIFKSQQKDDPELTLEEKKLIAINLLQKSHCLFLSKFGHFLKKEHLNYFNKNDEDYEVSYHINRLKRYFNTSKRHIDVKNKRYEALKRMIEEGKYFSEVEMMKRNPLLYEHLVGQYMTESQKKERDNLDIQNITFVNLLMESIEREGIKELRKTQQVEEEESKVEEDEEVQYHRSSENNSDESDECTSKINKRSQSPAWGETMTSEGINDSKHKKVHKNRAIVVKNISNVEKQILRQEFITNMYQSFLDGKDLDFDYR